jgi:hypothetical protein
MDVSSQLIFWSSDLTRPDSAWMTDAKPSVHRSYRYTDTLGDFFGVRVNAVSKLDEAKSYARQVHLKELAEANPSGGSTGELIEMYRSSFTSAEFDSEYNRDLAHLGLDGRPQIGGGGPTPKDLTIATINALESFALARAGRTTLVLESVRPGTFKTDPPIGFNSVNDYRMAWSKEVSGPSRGGPVWPANDGFAGPSSPLVLQPGHIIDRLGSENGRFASPAGTPYPDRSLPIGSDKLPLRRYEIIQPLEVDAGPAASWFGQPGGGIQYNLRRKIIDLKGHFLRPLDEP